MITTTQTQFPSFAIAIQERNVILSRHANATDFTSRQVVSLINGTDEEILRLREARAPVAAFAAVASRSLTDLRALLVGPEGMPLPKEPVLDADWAWDPLKHAVYFQEKGSFEGKTLVKNPPVHSFLRDLQAWLAKCGPFQEVEPSMQLVVKDNLALIEQNAVLRRREQALQEELVAMKEHCSQELDTHKAMWAQELQDTEALILENEAEIQERLASVQQMCALMVADLRGELLHARNELKIVEAEQQARNQAYIQANMASEAAWKQDREAQKAACLQKIRELETRIDKANLESKQDQEALVQMLEAAKQANTMAIASMEKKSKAAVTHLREELDRRPEEGTLKNTVEKLHVDVHLLGQENAQLRQGVKAAEGVNRAQARQIANLKEEIDNIDTSCSVM
jgi:hypothetical protein